MKPPTRPAPTSTTSSLLSTETILFLTCAATLVFGSLWSTFTVSPELSPYNPQIQAHDPATAPSYFARKDNILNVFFVKKGWAWITLAFFALHLSQPAPRPAPPAKLMAKLGKAVLRYATATAAWFLVTQWAFGPALIDRTFALSGGMCAAAARAEIEEAMTLDPILAGAKHIEGVATGAACRAAGGMWTGGHDISGHVFLLILGGGMLVLETLPFLRRAGMDAGVSAAAKGGVRATLVVTGLSWWMLLMTAAYFHTWFEKLTGFLVALTALSVVYVLPREVAVLRQVLGRPGQ